MKALKACALLVAAAALAACSSTPVSPAGSTSAPSAAAAATPSGNTPARSASTSTVPGVTLAEYLDPKNPLSTNRSVYFEFDDSVVGKQYAPLIELHAKFLASHPAVAIKIEGNADERGSAEYNLALGQRRAQAVLAALKIYGVKDAQMEAISWGSERPKASGHDETAWAQNRRADLAYPAK